MLKRLRRTFAQSSDTFKRMNCAHAAKLMPLYVADELTNKRAAAVARHLRACAHCRAQADEYAASRAWLQAAAQPAFDDKFYDEIRARVLSQIRQTQRPAPPQAVPFFAPRFNRQVVYVAASVALLALVGALAWQIAAHHSGRKQTIIANANTVVETATPTPKVIETPTPVNSPVPAPMLRRAPVLRRHAEQRQSVASNTMPSRTPREVNRPEFQPEPTPTPQQGVAQVNAAQQTVATSSSAEVARIELQTADPNIRIIWLAQQPTDVQPTKDK